MKTLIRVAVAALVVGLVATSALAAGAPNRAETLVLKKSDFPPGTTVMGPFADASPEVSGVSATFKYRTAGKPNELSASVIVAKRRALALAMFRELRSDMGPADVKLELRPPLYGDEQVASFSFAGGSRLIVRKGSVVWALELQTFLTRRGQTHELTKAEAIAEYQRYGRKQQQRVGKG